MPKQKKMWDNTLTVIMTLLSLLWIYPIVLILLNSLKIEGTFTTSTVFKLPTAETFAGLSNYVYGVTKMGFLSSLGYSLVITVTSVALILLCCSMTGWYLTRVNNKLSKFMNLLILADEPTGALDSHSSQMLLSTIQSINEDLGATILMVTHDAFSASYANRILFMRDGAIFTEIRKGGDSRRTFFEKILDVLTMMGGGMSDVR